MNSTAMKAISLVDKTNIKVVTIPKPRPKNGEVLVKVKYCALDTAFKELQNRTLVARLFLHNLRVNPLVPCYHYSGVVESIADGSPTDLKDGDEVFGHLQYSPSTRQGSLSEYITVPVSECAKVPEGVALDVAATVTSEALTALQALKDEAAFSEGKSILIIGADGAVGSQAVQISKAMKAGRVHAVCSTKDVSKVEQFGADLVIDRSATDIKKNLEPSSYDVIFDATEGKYSFFSLKYALKKRGTFVCTIPSMTSCPPMSSISPLIFRKHSKLVSVSSKRNDLNLIGSWLQSNQLSVPFYGKHDVKDIEDAVKFQEDPERPKSSRVCIKLENCW